MPGASDFPSTPSRVSTDTQGGIPISPMGPEPSTFKILPRVANIPSWIRKYKDPHINTRSILIVKFVDDGINTANVNMTECRVLEQGEQLIRQTTSPRTQELLQHIPSGQCQTERHAHKGVQDEPDVRERGNKLQGKSQKSSSMVSQSRIGQCWTYWDSGWMRIVASTLKSRTWSVN